jgi:hypothetical protein
MEGTTMSARRRTAALVLLALATLVQVGAIANSASAASVVTASPARCC